MKIQQMSSHKPHQYSQVIETYNKKKKKHLSETETSLPILMDATI